MLHMSKFLLYLEQSEVKNGLIFDHFKKMLNKTKRSILIIENDDILKFSNAFKGLDYFR